MGSHVGTMTQIRYSKRDKNNEINLQQYILKHVRVILFKEADTFVTPGEK